jgi:hypothetical protein
MVEDMIQQTLNLCQGSIFVWLATEQKDWCITKLVSLDMHKTPNISHKFAIVLKNSVLINGTM